MEDAVKDAVEKFVGQIAILSDEPYIREGVMKMALREVAWALFEEFQDQDVLADQLQIMADAIREHRDEFEA